MSRFDDAVQEGMRCGFEKVWTDQCDGRDDPEERCPMRLADGCACYYRAYHAAPFWKRWRMEKPRRPPMDAVVEAMVHQRVEEVAPLVIQQKLKGSPILSDSKAALADAHSNPDPHPEPVKEG